MAGPGCAHRTDHGIVNGARDGGVRTTLADYVVWLGMRELIGREREQGRLTDLLDRAERGDGGLALIRGEAGIGKTALARWAEVEADVRGFIRLRGRCHAHGSEVSYGPLVEAIGRTLRSRDADDLHALTDRIGGLSVLFPGLVDEPDPSSVPDELALTQTLEALRGILVRLVTTGPLLLVIDDVQWADAATLRALAHLSGELEAAPIAMILTLRDGDEADRSDVRTLLAALRRTCPVDELKPARLDASETKRVLAALLADGFGPSVGEPMPADVVDAIFRRTAGTPLFVESLAREMLENPNWRAAGRPDPEPPSAVSDAIAERLHELTEDDRDVLAAVAMASTETDLGAIQRITQFDDVVYGRAVDRLLARRLITVELGPGGVEVAHPLIAEVAEHLLSPLERSRLHARFLAVASDDADPEVAALHVLGAGDRLPVDQALAVLNDAAAQAAARHAYRSTVAHAGRALALMEPLDRPAEELAIRRRLAGALLGLGEPAEAAIVAEGALGLDGVDPAARLPALSQAEVAAWLTGTGTEELARLDDALADIAFDDHRPEVLRALELRLTAHARRQSARLTGHVDDMVVRTVDDPAPPVRALYLIGSSYRHELDGRHHQAVPLLEEVLAELAGVLPAWQVHRARIVMVDCLAHVGPVDRLRAAVEAVVGDGEGIYISWRDHITSYLCGLAGLEPGALDLKTASPIAFDSASSASWPDPIVMAHRAWLLEDGDRLAAVAAEIAAKRQQFPDRRSVVHAAEAIAHLQALASGDPEVARQRVQRLLEPKLSALFGREQLEVTHRMAILAGAAHLALASEEALRRADGGDGWASAQARFLEGQRLCALPGDGSPLESTPREVLADAAHRLERAGDRHRLALCLTDLAEATGAVDSRLPALLGPVEKVGLAGLADRIRAVVGRSATTAALAVAEADRGAVVSLTPRQLEIAELVAEGLGNAAIADQLFISVRTVTSHLDHIYTKLDIKNRTELAIRLPDLR